MQSPIPYKKYLGIITVLFFTLFIITPKHGHPYDEYCWATWASYIFEHGLNQIYSSSTDYLPLFHYILKGYALFQNSISEVQMNINYLKPITLVFHFTTAFFIFKILRKTDKNPDTVFLNTLFYLLNVAVLYNCLIWNQVDIILACLVFMSCYFAIEHQVLTSILFLVLALNFKLHAIIFVPVIGLLLLPTIVRGFSLKKICLWLIIPALLQFLIVLPFIVAGTIDKLMHVVTGSVGKFPVISANAFNLWHLLIEGKLDTMSDDVIAYGLSYKMWGLILFFLFSTLALFPLLKQSVYVIFKKETTQVATDKVLLICALIPMLFFYFNTQMHERYAHPALAFLITHCLLHKKPLLAILGSLAYFLNLEAVLKYLQLPNYNTFIFDKDFISCLWLVTILGMFTSLYNLKFKTFFRFKKTN